MINGFNVGIREVILLLMIAVFGIIPWIAGVWALVTLNRIRLKVDAIERHLKA